jgi:hypothetical protein
MGHFQVRQVLVYQRVHRFFLGFWWSISQLSRGDDVILEKVTGYLEFGGEVPFKSWDSHGSQFRETDPVNHDRVTTGIRTGFRTASHLHDSIHIPISPISVGFSQLDMIHIRHSNVPGWMSTPNVTAVKIYRGAPPAAQRPWSFSQRLRCIHTLKGHHTEIVCVAFNIQVGDFCRGIIWRICLPLIST